MADEWRDWLVEYAKRLVTDARPDAQRQAEMRATSPKFIPREWMLAEAYVKAEAGDFEALHTLEAIFAAPFDEHEAHSAKYYRRTPTEAARRAGLAYFS